MYVISKLTGETFTPEKHVFRMSTNMINRCNVPNRVLPNTKAKVGLLQGKNKIAYIIDTIFYSLESRIIYFLFNNSTLNDMIM